jgi:hypothetical protein
MVTDTRRLLSARALRLFAEQCLDEGRGAPVWGAARGGHTADPLPGHAQHRRRVREYAERELGGLPWSFGRSFCYVGDEPCDPEARFAQAAGIEAWEIEFTYDKHEGVLKIDFRKWEPQAYGHLKFVGDRVVEATGYLPGRPTSNVEEILDWLRLNLPDWLYQAIVSFD